MNLAQYEDEVDRNEEEADSFARDEHALSHDSATDPVPDCWCCNEELDEAKRRSEEDNENWIAALRKLPEAGNTQSGHGNQPWPWLEKSCEG